MTSNKLPDKTSQEADITKMLAAMTHIGSENSETTMMQYIYKRRTDGVNIINMHKTWEKLLLAARYENEKTMWTDLFVLFLIGLGS